MIKTFLKPFELKIPQQFGCDKFIYCSDAGLATQANRNFKHLGKRAFIVTQSIKKLRAEDKAAALNQDGYQKTQEIPYISENLD